MGIAYADGEAGYRGKGGYARQVGTKNPCLMRTWRGPYRRYGYILVHSPVNEEGRCPSCGKKPRTKTVSA